ncbi:MAG: hypothetical protein JRE21_05665 [Deltaproteobacteria bacterium]|nr:hypothetical protein [Deltaproteobacteria bacterium]
MHKLNKEELINAAKRADKKTDGPLSQRDFVRITGIREWQIENLFTEGGWSELKRLAKIESQPASSKKLSLKNAFTQKKVIAKEMEIGKEPEYAEEDIMEEENGFAEFDRLELTELESIHESTRPPMSPPAQPNNGMEENMKMEMAEFGELIDFRGLRHAPINENGVIFLFGMVSHELGFMVEAVHAAFPDCEAKRHIGENRYQRVRIKFEYNSGNFISNGYDPAGADMIVCWVHDWDDCPLEVLELKSTLAKLES